MFFTRIIGAIKELLGLNKIKKEEDAAKWKAFRERFREDAAVCMVRSILLLLGSKFQILQHITPLELPLTLWGRRVEFLKESADPELQGEGRKIKGRLKSMSNISTLAMLFQGGTPKVTKAERCSSAQHRMDEWNNNLEYHLTQTQPQKESGSVPDGRFKDNEGQGLQAHADFVPQTLQQGTAPAIVKCQQLHRLEQPITLP
ncbi:MAG: hypothetical protein Q9223_004216 [Gallowayella weberi]